MSSWYCCIDGFLSHPNSLVTEGAREAFRPIDPHESDNLTSIFQRGWFNHQPDRNREKSDASPFFSPGDCSSCGGLQIWVGPPYFGCLGKKQHRIKVLQRFVSGELLQPSRFEMDGVKQ